MGRRGTRADYRDVWQRCKVMDSESAAINVRRKVAVGHTRSDRHCTRLCVKLDLVEVLQRNLFLSTVGDVVEGVPRSQSFHVSLACDGPANIVRRAGQFQ